MFAMIVAVLLAVLALLTIEPSILPFGASLSLQFPWAQMIALRGVLAVGFLVLAVLCFALSLVKRRRIAAICLSIVFAVTAVGHGLTVWNRGIQPADLTTDPGITVTSTGNGSITAMELNTLGGKATAQDIANIMVSRGVDVASLPEAPTTLGEEVVAILKKEGLSFQQFDPGISKWNSDYSSTVLLVSSTLGTYQQIDVASSDGSSSKRTVGTKPVDGNGPTFIAVHPISPDKSLMSKWKEQARAAYALCAAYPDAVVLGDFNSTADHEAAMGVSGCTDAAVQAHVGGIGTWPSNVPALFSAPIDRIFTADGYEGTAGEVIAAGESDHRALVVRLTPKQK